MQKEIITKDVNGINRCLEVEVNNDKSVVTCIEEGHIQLILSIPEDVINLDAVKFKKRKYAPIFDYYLENGIKELKISEIDTMINNSNHRGNKCEYKMVFHNVNGVCITEDNRYYNRNNYVASFENVINGVVFRFTRRNVDLLTYGELNNLKQEEAVIQPDLWGYVIAFNCVTNKYGEALYKVRIEDITYTLLKDSYERINRREYLSLRQFFEEGSTLFVVTDEQRKTMAKRNLLKGEENFIKYIDWDGTVYI